MYRDFLTNKWVSGGVGFLIVLSVACVLWYQHDIADERKAAAEAEHILRQSQIAKSVSDTDSVAEQTTDVSAESNTQTAEKPITERTVPANAKDVVSGGPQNGAAGMPPVENTEPVSISPHGFGPYPEIPADYPHLQSWDQLAGEEDPEWELIAWVMIKLWKQGKHVIAANTENGLVFPTLENTVYVKWSEFRGPDGTVRYISDIQGDPDAGERISVLMDKRGEYESFDESDIPSDITLIPYDEGGINPYTFLDLPNSHRRFKR